VKLHTVQTYGIPREDLEDALRHAVWIAGIYHEPGVGRIWRHPDGYDIAEANEETLRGHFGAPDCHVAIPVMGKVQLRPGWGWPK